MTTQVPKNPGSAIQGIEYTDDQEYPFLVIRWMSGVYGKKKISFVREGESGFQGDCLVVVADGPCASCSQVPSESLPKLIAAIMTVVVRDQRRMCLVLSRKSAVFIEPDGKVNWSGEPPSGGLLIPDPVIEGDSI